MAEKLVSRRAVLKGIMGGIAGGAVAGGFGGMAFGAKEIGVGNELNRAGWAAKEAYAMGAEGHDHFYAAVRMHVLVPQQHDLSYHVTAGDLREGVDGIAKKLGVHPFRVIKALITPENKLTPHESATLEAVEEAEARGSAVSRKVADALNNYRSTTAHQLLEQFGGKWFSEEVDSEGTKTVKRGAAYVHKPFFEEQSEIRKNR